MHDVLPRRDGQRIWKILKKIQLRTDHGVEKLRPDHGVEELMSDHGVEELSVDIGPCRQRVEFLPYS